MATVSILMPAYNAEKYINMAIESVICQQFSDWELIIVDDCSTDSTRTICEKYAGTDNRIKLFSKLHNEGISKSKNDALDRAQGKYIAFCDDDDIMDINALMDNVKIAEDNNLQLVRWSYNTIKVDENGNVYQKTKCKCENGLYLCKKDIFDNYRNVHKMLSCDWTGLYRRDYLVDHNIRFNENFQYGGEDTMFNIEVLEHIERMAMNEETYYDWYLRKKHSTTAKRNINFCISMNSVAKKEKDLINRNCIDRDNLCEEYEAFYKKLISDYAASLSPDDRKVVDEMRLS